jgi:hypothetical protein
MRPADRALILAAAASAALHLAALFGTPGFDFGLREQDPPEVPPIQARLVPAEVPPPVITPPAARADRAQPRARRSTPAPRPITQAPVVPSYDYPEPGVDAVDAGEPTLAAQSQPGEAAVEAPAATPAEETAPPVEYPVRHARLVFDLYYGAHPTKVGQVTHTFAQDGGEYHVETVAEAVGFASWLFSDRLVLRASGRLAAAGLLPAEYRAEIGPRGRTEVARFDWSDRKIALEAKAKRRLVELPAGAQDPLSMLHQVYFMRPIPAAAQLDIATGRKLYRYVSRLVGETQLETPLGVVRALQVRSQGPDGASMDVWLDLDRNLLPARVQAVDRKGHVLAQVIREVKLELADDAQ